VHQVGVSFDLNVLYNVIVPQVGVSFDLNVLYNVIVPQVGHLPTAVPRCTVRKT